jgi:ferritin-like metal-binding protein YciE
MEKMKDLKDLLIHEIQDLYSAEEQIIEALPLMIKKAKDAKLLKALKDHLKVTEQQKARLDEVKKLLIGENEEQSEQASQKGFFGGFFGTQPSKQVCLGMQGLIEEGQKVMGEDMSPKVLDAAIIACAQKIEHYEICGYGTARAFARELNLGDVAEKLEETLDEEYEADDLLTDLAVGGLNEDAEMGNLRRTGSRSGRRNSGSKANGSQKSASAKKGTATGRGSSKGSLRTNKSARPKAGAKSSGGSKTKSGASKSNKSRGK